MPSYLFVSRAYCDDYVLLENLAFNILISLISLSLFTLLLLSKYQSSETQNCQSYLPADNFLIAVVAGDYSLEEIEIN